MKETRKKRGIRELIDYMIKYEALEPEEARQIVERDFDLVEGMLQEAPLGAPLYRMISDELLMLDLAV